MSKYPSATLYTLFAVEPNQRRDPTRRTLTFLLHHDVRYLQVHWRFKQLINIYRDPFVKYFLYVFFRILARSATRMFERFAYVVHGIIRALIVDGAIFFSYE